MAWIESHQELRDHPKVKRLAKLMGWSHYECMGRLHIFWFWAIDHAIDGDLRRYNDGELAEVIGLDESLGQKLVEAMVTCWHRFDEDGNKIVSGFIDRSPYFRIHDWWEYAGSYIRSKYSHQPKKWQKIKELYSANGVALNFIVNNNANSTCYAHAMHTTPNLTKPNQTKIKEKETDKEKENYIVSTTAVSTSPPPNKFLENAREILTFLNAKAGRRYPSSKVNLDFIICRLKEGAGVAQCRQIIAKKCREWSTDEKMKYYLRPATLFNRTKFNQYVGELIPEEENNENN